ncbi:hypothetical protein ACF1AO_23790 [Streptomyces longwoodensis]|uniref:hypothetical protein n=1 Tax=Streptomyces longwoodensis TaxID=68231 RepID=UPI0036F7A9CC
MVRRATARIAAALLTALLLALPFVASGTSAPPFALAHTTGHTEARPGAGTAPSAAAPREERVTHRDCDRPGAPSAPLRARDRVRAVAAGPVHQGAERARTAHDDSVPLPPSAAGAAPRPSRSATGHSPAVLQVFRC